MMSQRYEAPPSKRIRTEEVVNPCSGRYEGGDRSADIELIVDIDKTKQYTPALGVVSGIISGKKKGSGPWSMKAGSLYFKVIPITLEISGGNSNNHDVTGNVKAVFSDGTKVGGRLTAKLAFSRSTWKAGIDLQLNGQRNLSFKNVERSSTFFKDIMLDIDFTEKLTWPTAVLGDLRQPPAGMADIKLDAFSAFEDAGIKLHFDEAHSKKVKDSSQHSPWTKSDLYEAMMKYFDESDNFDENIWCMMGTTPPDKRYMGFSFDRKGRQGFGLFTGHRTFAGLEASCKKTKAEAQLRLLHYLVHECGHCLGLKHPFEIGAEESLSWMNYAWKYDMRHKPGSFYKSFRFRFSDQELLVLRHAPGKAFRTASTPAVLSAIMGEGYSPKSEAPDHNLADDDDDYDVESGYRNEDAAIPKPKKKRPMRKIGLDLKVQSQYSRGHLVSFEARVKNLGKLPVLIEGDLSLNSGNLQLYVTKPDGNTEVVNPFVRPIYTGYSKPRVLYTPEDKEGADRYSELVTVSEGSEGYQIGDVGMYEVRAVYRGGRYKATSASYTIEVVADDDDDDEDQEMHEEIRTAATLQASSSNRFQKALAFWHKLDRKTVDKKKSKVATLIAVMEGLANENARHAKTSEKRGRGRRQMAFFTVKPAITRKQLIKGTSDMVQFYQQQGEKADNMDYSSLVLARAKVYVADNRVKEADSEVNQMMNDLLGRGAKYDVLIKLTKKWKKIKNPPNVADKYTPENLQKKVNSVLTWAPSTYGDGEPDLSGIGLGKPFSNFDVDQIQQAEKIIEMLFTKYDETQDIYATIGYADKLQKGREVNSMVLRWALEAFIVHSMDAKKAGIKYPEPDYRDESFMSDAAMVVTRREGHPAEDWMNYWRCDADLNYHHRHWHIVYVVRKFLRRINGVFEFGENMPPHLERQGELFGYMHNQLLARYDADRESWGLPPVQPWEYDETSMPFNAGLEFHSDPQWNRYVPRPPQQWPSQTIAKFMGWERAYDAALKTGVVASGVELTPNWSGHILEASSGIYRDKFGSIHNTGHGVFGSTMIPPTETSYMSNTVTAVRDPIFCRWHKKIDILWQKNNDYYRSELAHDAPPVIITADDIILSNEPKPPADFNKFAYGKWASTAPSEKACLKTYLGPAKKKYEWDNKLSHEKFFYHLRLKRNADSIKTEEVNLTIRIFICPLRRVEERKRWIEMDKFVCKIPAGEERVQVTRADVHSSVIKRLHEQVDEVEKKYVTDAGGFCECGWPYDMLLPRGKKEGEEYVISVIATDNRIDNIGIRTSCGSMSYCGAKGEKYPDSRNMGYPFSNPITFKGEEIPIPLVFDTVSNAAYKKFKIKNNVTAPPAVKAVDCWWPYMQLQVNDGTMRREPQGGITEYLRSDLVGKFRVLIDSDYAKSSETGRLLIRFQGRGSRGGAYVISDIVLALRKGNTMNTIEGEEAKVTYKGQEKFTVPESGLISDPVDFRLDPGRGDYFLTFTLESPGVYLPASQSSTTFTYHIPAGLEGVDFKGMKSPNKTIGRFSYIQCVGGIMREIE